MSGNIQKNYYNIIDKITRCTNQKIHLIAVSKFKPVSDMLELYQAGHRVFGENRIQEAKSKKPELPQDLELHFIGALQTNKAKYITAIFNTVHSLCNLASAEILEKKCSEQNKTIKVFIQMNLCQEDSKQGVKEYQKLLDFSQAIINLPHLKLVGLMTIPKAELTLNQTGKIYAKLREYKEDLEKELNLSLPELSMGMSADFEVAIKEGATYIRIGSAIFGGR